MIDNKGCFYKPWHRGGVRPWLMGIGLGAALLGGTTGLVLIAAGACLVLASMLIQFWSKGCLHQNAEVTRAGPYRFVRHPFYFSNLLLDAGIVTMSGFLPLMVLAPLWWLAVYIPAMRKEEDHLKALFEEQYQRYMERVPRLFPVRSPLPPREGAFQWDSRNILATEIPRAIRYLTYPLLFLLAMQLSRQGLTASWQPTAEQLWLGVVLAGLALTSRVWKIHYKHGRRILPGDALRLENRVLYIMLIMMSGVAWDAVDPFPDPWFYRLPGLVALSVSLAAMSLVARRPLLAEAGLAVAMAVLLELQWFAVLLIPLYLALSLDTGRPGARTAGLRRYQPLTMHSYSALVLIGLVTVTITETWI